MAHRIQIDDGRASMMYVGPTPWHGLGTQLAKPATALEAIKAANLGWDVLKQPLYAGEPRCLYPVEGKFAVVPANKWGQEECPILGIVGDDYTPLQNSEAFEFFDPIVGEGAAIYHTAGALEKGERIWILAKLPGYIEVVGEDIAEKYLLLSNSHDGNGSVQIKFTPIRVVCHNTLTMALKSGRTIRVAHHRDLKARLNEARRTLGIINTRYQEIEKSFRAMVKVKMTEGQLKEYLTLVFPDAADPDDKRAAARVAQSRKAAGDLFVKGYGNAVRDVEGSLWAAYNGVTQSVDHKKHANDERHLESIWFGNGYLVKARAFEVAKQQMPAWAR